MPESEEVPWPGAPSARWWTVRPARSLNGASYHCPFCGLLLHAMSDHLLLLPEGEPSGRRHAHEACVLRARAAGKLPSAEEQRSASRTAPGVWGRLLERVRGSGRA